ncbi:MAG: hypothetical protein ACYSSL_05850 [Planctomycetota bacterium]|jgi:hypothetical protein
MKESARKAIISGICIVFIVILAAGCEEQSVSSKKSRLIATENVSLKKQLEQQKRLVAKCQQEKEEIKQRSREEMGKLSVSLVEDFQEKIRLTEENEALKAEIEELKGGE